ncbi:hypothetical protein F4861DRAFT_541161 [Xylaria intraflava]|nr:hypothetical protein F4861DRAFT_541161 [Xylaria intraflava]
MPVQSTQMMLSAAGSIVGSAWVSGNISAISFLTIPCILQSGAAIDGIARAWRVQFIRTAYIPITTVVAALNYLFLAHQHRAAGLEWRGYAGGALANLMLLPFTQIFIMGINRKLMASTGDGKKLSNDEARRLVDKWGNLNKFRIFIPLTGATLGLWNLLINF